MTDADGLLLDVEVPVTTPNCLYLCFVPYSAGGRLVSLTPVAQARVVLSMIQYQSLSCRSFGGIVMVPCSIMTG